LDKAKFDEKKDHVIFTGDMIQKGPDSHGVVQHARKIKASCVRGNHEDRVLLANRDLRMKTVNIPGPEEQAVGPESVDTMEEESFSHGDYLDRKLARNLTDEDIKYLETCPLILDVGQMANLGNVVVAHAGLVPGVKLSNQDPFAVMNMRTVDLETHVPSPAPDGIVWTKVSLFVPFSSIYKALVLIVARELVVEYGPT
jgi:hypothetical protein